VNRRSATDWWEPNEPSPYAFRVVDLPAAKAGGALEWGYVVGTAVSGTGGSRWLVDAGPAHLHVDRLVRPVVVPLGTGPLLILRGWFVRRWVRLPTDVELSSWSAHRSELAVRTRRSPLRYGWYFPAAAEALRSLSREITAWAGAIGDSASSIPRSPPRRQRGHD
jgi:hypothetical protein